MAFGAPSLKGHALRWLSQREHSRAELARKLARHVWQSDDGGDPDAAQALIDKALDELAAAGLLSDTRAAESVLAAQGRRFGTHRLKQVLQDKGLASELVTQTLQAARATELDRARSVWQRRFGAGPADAAERARQMRFLAGRGFDGEVIRRVIRDGVGADVEPDGS
jgi:regulatory protein